MGRFLFPIALFSALLLLIPLLADETGGSREHAAFALSEPDLKVDVDDLRAHTNNRALLQAGEGDLSYLRSRSLAQWIRELETGPERELRLVAAALGASGHPDAVKPLVRAFAGEDRPLALAALATALAETRRTEAVAALIAAIRARTGVAAYEACRALRITYGVNFGLDADAWERWLKSAQATRD